MYQFRTALGAGGPGKVKSEESMAVSITITVITIKKKVVTPALIYSITN